MKKYLLILLAVIYIICQSFLNPSVETLYPIIDNIQFPQEPKNLRSTNKLLEDLAAYHGLTYLNASGSGQFSEDTFKEVVRKLGINTNELVVFDLRQESHGFVNGISVSWTDGQHNYGNRNKTLKEIEFDEWNRLQLAKQAGSLIVNPHKDPIQLAVSDICTEKNFIQSAGAKYIRLPVTDRNKPSDEVIDQFVEIILTMPNNHWLHFHCKAGKGRTTTFLTLYDMMKNGRYVSLEDILLRQKIIGGSDLVGKIEVESGERKRAAKERLELIEKFYRYCNEVPDFHVKWSEWIKSNQS